MKHPPSVPRVHRPSHDPHESPHGWELMVAGDLTDKQTELVEQLTAVAPRSRGVVYFDSCGGSAYTGISLACLLRLRGLEATAVVLGECSSAALLPFAACRRRLVTPHSSLFFHPVRWSSEEEVNLEEAAEWARHFRVLEQDMDRLLSRLFGMDYDRLVTWTRPGRFFTGAEIVEAGLAEMVDLFSGDLEQQAGVTLKRRG